MTLDGLLGAFDAVVLAGGAGRRLGGVDKPATVVRGRRLLDVALDAVAGAGRTVVVGPQRPTPREVTWAREDPPGGGPAAALAAGLAHVSAPHVVVLAADLPLVTPDVVLDLRAANVEEEDGAALVDDTGRLQPLASCWWTAVLQGAVERAGDLSGASVRSLLHGLEVVPVPARDGAWLDCDTPADVRRAEELP